LKEAAYIVGAYWIGLLPFLPLTPGKIPLINTSNILFIPGAFEVPVPGEVFQYETKFSLMKKLFFFNP